KTAYDIPTLLNFRRVLFRSIHALDLRVEGRGITGFLGRNGAGKSSTLKMLLGMSRPSSGIGAVFGHRIDDASASLQMRRRIAYEIGSALCRGGGDISAMDES